MSRLDSAIQRLQAQRDCLAMAARRIVDVEGPVLEIGLGNGRTYDHIRRLLPERAFFVFEREVQSHPDCTPSQERLILGDLADTLPDAREIIVTPASLAHADIGCGDPVVDRNTATLLCTWLPKLVAKGGLVLCDQPLENSRLEPQSLPETVHPGRYYCYQVMLNPG